MTQNCQENKNYATKQGNNKNMQRTTRKRSNKREKAHPHFEPTDGSTQKENELQLVTTNNEQT